MKRHYKKYSDQDIIDYAKTVNSIAGLLRRLGLKPAGGNYINIKKKLKELNVDTSHWTGQGWSKGQQLKDWDSYTKIKSLKKILIKRRGEKCEVCNRTEWLKTPITLEIHHLDGDRTNNKEDNLQLLCPNCHSITHNWRGKKGE